MQGASFSQKCVLSSQNLVLLDFFYIKNFNKIARMLFDKYSGKKPKNNNYTEQFKLSQPELLPGHNYNVTGSEPSIIYVTSRQPDDMKKKKECTHYGQESS